MQLVVSSSPNDTLTWDLCMFCVGGVFLRDVLDTWANSSLSRRPGSRPTDWWAIPHISYCWLKHFLLVVVPPLKPFFSRLKGWFDLWFSQIALFKGSVHPNYEKKKHVCWRTSSAVTMQTVWLSKLTNNMLNKEFNILGDTPDFMTRARWEDWVHSGVGTLNVKLLA